MPSTWEVACKIGRPLTDKEMEFFLQLEDRRAREAENRRAREAEEKRAQQEHLERLAAAQARLAEIKAETRRIEVETQERIAKAKAPSTDHPAPMNVPVPVQYPRKLQVQGVEEQQRLYPQGGSVENHVGMGCDYGMNSMYNQADTLTQPQNMHEVWEGGECESGKLSVASQAYGEQGKSFSECLPEGDSCVSVSEASTCLPGASEERLESDFWALSALFRERVPLVQSGVTGQSESLVGEKDQILEGVQCEQPVCVEPGSLAAEEGSMHVGEGFLPSSLSTGGACQPGLAEESAVGPDLALGAAEAQKGEGEVSDLSPEESVCFPEGGAV
ncbi:uncharacterized protein LOC142829540 [Pelodiscus sinensis]|uniref:uncharacterized protein LOC142829540 n=1 Tax=Pelodiscus sinensis TaxID=13735 RepID=UPI003F6B3BF2